MRSLRCRSNGEESQKGAHGPHQIGGSCGAHLVFKSLPNKIGYLLGMSSKNLESIIYYEKFVVIQTGIKEGEVKNMDLLSEEDYLAIVDSLPKENHMLEDSDPNKFIAKMGAEAIFDLLMRLDLANLSYDLRHQASVETSQQRKSEALKRLRVVEAFKEGFERNTNRPEWTIIQYLPVIPPELRPLVPLDGGRFASSTSMTYTEGLSSETTV